MDMHMPVMSGLDATQAIRAGSGPNARTPIIALTANAFDDDRSAWLNAGAADFLTKPIDPARLIDSILKTTEPLDDDQPPFVEESASPDAPQVGRVA
jgi:CheY-like chemotaxis protein